MDRIKERLYPHVYVIVQDWASGVDQYNSTDIYTDYDDAKHDMDALLKEEMERSIADMRNKNKFVEESTEDAYECYVDGEYCENHYSIAIEMREMCVSKRFIEELERMGKTENEKVEVL